MGKSKGVSIASDVIGIVLITSNILQAYLRSQEFAKTAAPTPIIGELPANASASYSERQSAAYNKLGLSSEQIDKLASLKSAYILNTVRQKAELK